MVIRLLWLLVLFVAALAAQFSTFPGGAYFREQWSAPPLDVEIESVARLEDFESDGTLRISLRRYVELVIANNPDIQLQKLAVFEQQNAIQRAFSPFDPTLTARFNTNRQNSPSNDILAGANVLTSLNQIGDFTYNQTFDTGTQYSVAFSANKNANNSRFQSFNPAITHRLSFSFSQPLLRGRGRFIQRIPILVAEFRLRLTEEQVEQRIIDLLFQAENAYWNVVDARESLRVQENNLELARAFLERSRRELELGAISPLDIYQPEQQFATAQLQVTQASYRLEQNVDVLRRWIGADLDSRFRRLPIELTESIEAPPNTEELDAEEQVAQALRARPELEQSHRSLEIADLNIRQATNQLRPDLALTANYNSTGRGGNFFERDLLDPTVGTFIPGGFPEALDQLFQFRYPTYGFGFTLNLPLRNRAAAADLADSTIQKKRDLYTMRSLEQQIRQEVLNAVTSVELSRAAVQQAGVARDFAQKRLEAEQRKYDLGVQTAFFVLDAQTALVQAEADVVAQSIAYRRSVTTLLQATGRLLDARGVVLRY